MFHGSWWTSVYETKICLNTLSGGRDATKHSCKMTGIAERAASSVSVDEYLYTNKGNGRCPVLEVFWPQEAQPSHMYNVKRWTVNRNMSMQVQLFSWFEPLNNVLHKLMFTIYLMFTVCHCCWSCYLGRSSTHARQVWAFLMNVLYFVSKKSLKNWVCWWWLSASQTYFYKPWPLTLCRPTH